MNPVSYRFQNGIPNQITQMNRPYTAISNLDNDFGMFAQDRWTMDRITLNLALRFDMFQSSFPEQTVGPRRSSPDRNITFPETDNISIGRTSPIEPASSTTSVGNGKTAIKVAANKYLLGQTLNGIGRNPNPVLALTPNRQSIVAARINRDYIPQCDLLNPLAEQDGEFAGDLETLAFGTPRPGEFVRHGLTSGWGHRPQNWEFSVGVQQELMRGVALDVGYFRRIWKQFPGDRQLLLVGPEDFTNFSMTVPDRPATSRPAVGRYTRPVQRRAHEVRAKCDNLNTLSDKYG